VAVVVDLITDIDDVWTHVRMLRGSGLSDLISRASWLVLDITFPFGRGEVPTFKNYANSLTKISPLPSARQVGTTGTKRWRYRVVPCDADGVCSPASDEFGVDDGNDTLDATDHVCLSWLDVAGVTDYKVYRTFSGGTPSSTGLIATVLPDLGDCGTGGSGGGDTGFKDIGGEGGEEFDESLCESETSITIGAKEIPTTVTFPAKEIPI